MKINSMVRIPKITLLGVSILACLGAAQCSASAQMLNATLSTKLVQQKAASHSFDSIRRLCSVNTVNRIFSAFKQRPLLYGIGAIGALSLASYLTYKTYQTVQNIRLDDVLWNTRRFWLNTKYKLFGRPPFERYQKPTQTLEERAEERKWNIKIINNKPQEPVKEEVKPEPFDFKTDLRNSVITSTNDFDKIKINFSAEKIINLNDNKTDTEEIDAIINNLKIQNALILDSIKHVKKNQITDHLASTTEKKHKKTNSFDSKDVKNLWKSVKDANEEDSQELDELEKLVNNNPNNESIEKENKESNDIIKPIAPKADEKKNIIKIGKWTIEDVGENGSDSSNLDASTNPSIIEKQEPKQKTTIEEKEFANEQPLPSLDAIPQNSKIQPYFKNEPKDYFRFVQEAQAGSLLVAEHLNDDKKFEIPKKDLEKTQDLFESNDQDKGLNSLKKQLNPDNLATFVGVQNKYLQTIRNITSFFALCTFSPLVREDETCFDQGTFKIYDPDNKLWNLLTGYRTFIENSGLTTKMTYNGYIGANYYVYDRASTHKAFGDDVFGIDFRKSEIKDSMVNAPESDLFLGKFKHLLIGHKTVNSKHYVWIKPEDAGLASLYSFSQHVEGVVTSKLVKILPEKWSNWLGFKSDDVKENNKERLPDNIKKLFASLFPTEKTKFTSVEEMHNFAKAQQNSVPAKQFIDLLSTLYINPAETTGKEIIIGEPQFLLADAYKEGTSSWKAGLFRKLEAVARATWACQKDFNAHVSTFKKAAEDFINCFENLSTEINLTTELPDRALYYTTVYKKLDGILKSEPIAQNQVVISLFAGENKESKNLDDSWVNLDPNTND